MPESYTSVTEYPVQNERFVIYGIFKRKKQFNDIPEVWKYEFCL